MKTNPFIEHRAMLIHGGYSTAQTLRRVALSMWNGHAYPLELHKIQSMDTAHYQIFQDMCAWYRRHGENCPDFMNLCAELDKIERKK